MAMRIVVPALVLLVSLTVPTFAFAQTNDLASLLIVTSLEKNLAEHPTWLKLGHYETGILPFTSIESAIKSETFFLSEDGRFNPESELIETLKAFVEDGLDNPDNHAQCRFAGRFYWLDQQLNFDSFGLTKINCPSFENWSLNGTTTSISLILATGYLGNPASYYGHTLIKLNSSRSTERTALEDISINYGAIVPPNEGPIPYILKGLFGGYDGGFSHTQYYFHDHNYGETELRDLWEYELNLQKNEVELLLAHSWEVLGKEYTYLFLTENCVYQMARLIEVIEGIELLPGFSAWVMPQTLVQTLSQSSRGGEPLVKEVTYHPSRQSRLYASFNSLSMPQKNLIKKITKNIDILDSGLFNEIAFIDQIEVLDTLLDYYQYIRDEEELGTDTNNKYYAKVLSKRFSLEPGQSNFNAISSSPPHNDRNPSLFRFSSINNDGKGHGVRFTLRPAYYDSLDAGSAHVKNAELKMAEVSISAINSKIYLQSLDVISIRSVLTKSTGLPGDKSVTWRLRLAAEQQSLQCTDCLAALIKADYGYTAVLSPSILIGTTVGISGHDNRIGSGNFSGSLAFFSNLTLSNRLSIGIEADRKHYLTGQLQYRTDYKIESRFSISRNSALRASFQKAVEKEIGLSLDYYF